MKKPGESALDSFSSQGGIVAVIVTIFYLLVATVLWWTISWGTIVEQGVGGKPVGALIAFVLHHPLWNLLIVVCCWMISVYVAAARSAATRWICLLLMLGVVLWTGNTLFQLRGAIELTLFAFGFRYF